MKTLMMIAAALCLATLVAGVPAVVVAQTVYGPYNFAETVRAHSEDRFEFRFYGGERAEVIVDGDGTTDLDLFVYDENWHMVASDDDNTDFCIAEWTPTRTGVFHIVVKNLGSIYNDYTFETN